MCRGVSHVYAEHPWLLTTHQPCLWLLTTLLRPSPPQGRPWVSSTRSRCPTSGSRVTLARSSSRGCPRGSRSESPAPLAPRTWRGSLQWLTRSSSPSPGTQETGEERGGKGQAGPRVTGPWPGLRVILPFRWDKAAFPAPPGSFPSNTWILKVRGGGPAGQLGCREPHRDETRSPAPPYTIAGAAFMAPVSLPRWLLAALLFLRERDLWPMSGRRQRQEMCMVLRSRQGGASGRPCSPGAQRPC